jgi:hypothetical protein
VAALCISDAMEKGSAAWGCASGPPNAPCRWPEPVREPLARLRSCVCGATSIEDTFFELAFFEESSFDVASFGASSYEVAPSRLPPSSAMPSTNLGRSILRGCLLRGFLVQISVHASSLSVDASLAIIYHDHLQYTMQYLVFKCSTHWSPYRCPTDISKRAGKFRARMGGSQTRSREPPNKSRNLPERSGSSRTGWYVPNPDGELPDANMEIPDPVREARRCCNCFPCPHDHKIHQVQRHVTDAALEIAATKGRPPPPTVCGKRAATNNNNTKRHRENRCIMHALKMLPMAMYWGTRRCNDAHDGTGPSRFSASSHCARLRSRTRASILESTSRKNAGIEFWASEIPLSASLSRKSLAVAVISSADAGTNCLRRVQAHSSAHAHLHNFLERPAA